MPTLIVLIGPTGVGKTELSLRLAETFQTSIVSVSYTHLILEKLDGLVARFEEISTLITDPAVIADQKRYVKLTKEYKELDLSLIHI